MSFHCQAFFSSLSWIPPKVASAKRPRSFGMLSCVQKLAVLFCLENCCLLKDLVPPKVRGFSLLFLLLLLAWPLSIRHCSSGTSKCRPLQSHWNYTKFQKRLQLAYFFQISKQKSKKVWQRETRKWPCCLASLEFCSVLEEHQSVGHCQNAEITYTKCEH